MQSFPETLVPESTTMTKMYEEHILSKFREKVFESVVTGNPENYVDLSAFEFSTYTDFKKLVAVVRGELEALGWTTALSYGDTALFVFSGNNKPKYCW
jgi:hypothetical protein